MIIDSHLHIGLNGWTEETLMKYLDDQGIDKAWLLTWDEMNPMVPIYYESLDVEMVKTAYRNFPDRIVPFYAPDPARSDWKMLLQRFLDDGFAGCAELKVPYRWNDPLLLPLLEFLNKKKLPLVFHMERARKIFIPGSDRGMDWFFKRIINERTNGVAAHHIEKWSEKTGIFKKYLGKHMIEFPGYLLDFSELEEAVFNFPDIRFIAHGPHFWNNISNPGRDYLFHQTGKVNGRGIAWDLLEKYPNFFCDLSGFSAYNAISRNEAFSREFLNTNHTKLLFGTDNSGLDMLGKVKELVTDASMLSDILQGNARKITE